MKGPVKYALGCLQVRRPKKSLVVVGDHVDEDSFGAVEVIVLAVVRSLYYIFPAGPLFRGAIVTPSEGPQSSNPQRRKEKL